VWPVCSIDQYTNGAAVQVYFVSITEVVMAVVAAGAVQPFRVATLVSTLATDSPSGGAKITVLPLGAAIESTAP
jgi:hypothetical protein